VNAFLKGEVTRLAVVERLESPPSKFAAGQLPHPVRDPLKATNDPTRFKRSRSVGAYAGLTTRRYASGAEFSVSAAAQLLGKDASYFCIDEAARRSDRREWIAWAASSGEHYGASGPRPNIASILS